MKTKQTFRIGLFSNSYEPFISGIVHSIKLIRSELIKRGHKVFVFAPEQEQFSDQHSGVYRFPAIHFSKQNAYPVVFPFSPRLWSIIDKLELDIFHAHHPLLLGDVAAHFARKQHRPLIYTFHTQLEEYSHYIPLPDKPVKHIARRTLEKFIEKCQHVITPSEELKPYIQGLKPDCPLTFLTNAINLGQFQSINQQQAREELNLDPDTLICIYSGRVAQEKNLDFLITAFKEALKKVHQRQVQLYILGEGDQLEFYRKKLKDDKHIHLPGRIDYERLPLYLQAADLFTMSSTTEVKPLAILEAFASGLPVLAISACGTKDTISHGHDGLLTTENLLDFSQQLSRVLTEDKLRKELAVNALKTSQQYDISHYCDQLLEVYQTSFNAMNKK